ncbi:bifunctional diguanylate cyclase/phosphodiesterase [Endozoicomonas sp. SCSIO W0465]|uniref:putative bifunctional diguanylate cyclase/phosphodiesterase n=1 Tax=Endozoicomonas sp. SCSIO W0465 TaxID=2918516 RepID=UPI0020761DAA|nr:bifunctional diguanylate cyclase/phosphodiesterase [Endozoicomonas sp. SCSIO W0465]USE35167.1 EAL domain-containing protein [Endozoicomonas sp. SCSIO W0465]
MDTHKDMHPAEHLSIKLLKVVLLCACILGVLLSLVQVFLDAHQSNADIDRKAREMLAMIHEPASRSAYRLDTDMAQEVLNGLLEIKSVQVAAIRLDDNSKLAMVERPIFASRYRLLSDYIFDPIRIHRQQLYSHEPEKEHFGELILSIDTAYEGKAFIQRSIVVLFAGIIRAIAMALLLYLIYSTLLTRPMNRLIHHLSSINPEEPGQQQLPVPEGNEKNELGLWVRTANKLLTSINYHQSLRQKAEARIMRLSQYDYLTRLPNRRTIQNQINTFIQKATKKHENIAILCLGLDDFKSLNAQVNFNAAEHILVKVADRLRNCIGNNAYIGRLGEDQFAIIQSKIEQPYEAAEMAQSLIRQLDRPFEINSEQLTISATVGITLFPGDGEDVDTLLQQAEFAMIMAKSRSHNRYQFYVATLDTEVRQRKRLEMDLHQALEKCELSLAFQPQFNYQQRKLSGAEALLRWNHPEKGLISPDMFIPMAEHSLDIIPIGDWVLENACQQLNKWHIAGFHNLRMAVNLSAIQLQDQNIADRIAFLLNKYQVPPEALELEVTETSIIDDLEASKAQLQTIKSIGVTLALDDFGTGYSSLGYLKQFPFDKIKIDKSFIEDLPENRENCGIVEAIVQIGKSFGLKVLAEGVETVEQDAYLAQRGCQEGQGYYYGKPLSAHDFISLVSSQSVSSSNTQVKARDNGSEGDNNG